MKIQTTTLLAATAILLSTSGAWAAGDDRPAAELQAEKAYIDTAFSKIDGNGDGTIDKAEWATFMASYMKGKRDEFTKAFTDADTNGDGKLSKNEAGKANPLLSQNFKTIDSDGDGFVTPAEIRAAINSQNQAR